MVDLSLHSLLARASTKLGYELNGTNSCGRAEASHITE
jgi:hypothetical protein